MNGRCIALDVGDKRVGVAVSDPLGITAQPLETYLRVSQKADNEHFMSLAASLGAGMLVCGLPRNMDGTLGGQGKSAMAYAEAVAKACGLPLEYVDERLTTAQARRELIQGGVRRDRRKQVIDQVAAAHILRSYLSSGANNVKENENDGQ